mmetsp:Transcript_13756/g.38772  ORF Transcript_13756/g.38772 Transcript_13756/m.38772 type:complete len:204 (+) Transcript_13756:2171-2782(+)
MSSHSFLATTTFLFAGGLSLLSVPSGQRNTRLAMYSPKAFLGIPMSGRGSELWLWSGAGCLGALELPAFAAACAFTPDAEALEEEDGGGRVEEEEEEPFPSATLPPLFFTNDDNLGISLSLSVHRSGRQESTSGALRFARGSETHTIQPSEVPQAVTPPATSRDCHKQARPPTNTRKRRNDQTPSPSSTKTFLSGADEPDTKN